MMMMMMVVVVVMMMIMMMMKAGVEMIEEAGGDQSLTPAALRLEH